MPDYETAEGAGRIGGGAESVEEARRLHHLASADPELDGTLTGPAHEEKYGLERAKDSAASWRANGVHPTENRALVGSEEGAENLRGLSPEDPSLQTTAAPSAPENTAAPRAASPTPAPSAAPSTAPAPSSAPSTAPASPQGSSAPSAS